MGRRTRGKLDLDAVLGAVKKQQRQLDLTDILARVKTNRPQRQQHKPQRQRRGGCVPIPWSAEDVIGPTGERIGRMDAAKARRLGIKHHRGAKPDLKPGFTPLPCFDDYDLIAVQVSGGKDSCACLLLILRLLRDRPDLLERVQIWHQDIDAGADPWMDWPVTMPYVEAMGELFGLRTVISFREGGFRGEVERPPGQRMGRRAVLHQGRTCFLDELKPPDPSLKSVQLGRRRFPPVVPDLVRRWCTGHLKIDVARALVRHMVDEYGYKTILTVTGERAEESSARASYYRGQDDGSTRTRTVHRWRPVYDYSEAEVYAELEHAFPGKPYGMQPHPIYELGWSRCSCSGCIFGGAKEWSRMAEITPGIYKGIADVERDLIAEAMRQAPPDIRQTIGQMRRKREEYGGHGPRMKELQRGLSRRVSELRGIAKRTTVTDVHTGRRRAKTRAEQRQDDRRLDEAIRQRDAAVDAVRAQRQRIDAELELLTAPFVGKTLKPGFVTLPQLVASFSGPDDVFEGERVRHEALAFWGPYLRSERPWTAKHLLRGPGAPIFAMPWTAPAGAFTDAAACGAP